MRYKKFNLKKWRMDNNLSQQEVADILGFAHRSSVHCIEVGKHKMNRRDEIAVKVLLEQYSSNHK